MSLEIFNFRWFYGSEKLFFTNGEYKNYDEFFYIEEYI